MIITAGLSSFGVQNSNKWVSNTGVELLIIECAQWNDKLWLQYILYKCIVQQSAEYL